MMSGGDGNQDDLAAAWGSDTGLEDEGDIGIVEEGGEQDDLAASWGADTGLNPDGEDGQDDLAASWGADLGFEGDEDGGDGGDVAAQWASLVDGGMDESSSERAARLLSQGEIDSLLGFQLSDGRDNDISGIKAILNSGGVSYERLPMLEIIFDRLVRLLTTSLRNFTSDNVEVTLDSITTIRFWRIYELHSLARYARGFPCKRVGTTLVWSRLSPTLFILLWMCCLEGVGLMLSASRVALTQPLKQILSSA